MNERYNTYHKRIIKLNEGEAFCLKCKGKGVVKQFPRTILSKEITLVCDKCLGDGKIDWIEKATGKRNRYLKTY